MSHVLPVACTRTIDAEFHTAMQERFGAQYSTALAVREQHGRDESAYTHIPPPDGVLWAESTKDVVDVMRLANRFMVPIIPFGVGSSLEGHLLAIQGGICLDLSRMNTVLTFNPEDLTATVQPGVTRKQLNEALKGTGLFFPIDPGADASIGGMAATRASGTNAVRYGTMRENVLALEVVAANGEVLRTGSRARKSSAGYDLTRLMVGSEGTLGIMTELTVRLYPIPEAISAAVCSFPSVQDAVKCTVELIQLGIPIARCELLDAASVRAVNQHSHLSLPDAALLLMEFHGSPAGVEEQVQAVSELAEAHNGLGFKWATAPEDRTRLWTARHQAYFAALQSRPGCKAITTDVCVPISQLTDCVLAALDAVHRSGLPHFLVGHVGDGNFHLGYLIDPHSTDERERAEQLNHDLVTHALRVGGTCTGEHGIGLHKMDFLTEEAGPGAIHMMRAIKHALDPKNLLNPGKVLKPQH